MSTPRAWLLTGGKAGDDAQARLLASALELPVDEKPLAFKPAYVQGKPWFRASFSHLADDATHGLDPPWPELVITVGRRPAMAALEIKKRSEGFSKIVLIGRPRQSRGFDLSVSPAQFMVPETPEICRVPWPFLKPDEARVTQAVSDWHGRFESLPRPLTAVFVGGATVPYALGASEGGELVRRVRQATKEEGFHYYCTSRRSSLAIVDALGKSIAERPDQERLFRWTADGADNPYLGLLGLADRFVVTGDSLSMMLEVAQLSRPLALYVPPLGLRPRSLLARGSRPFLYRWDQCVERFEPRGLTNRLFSLGAINYARDLGAIHRQLLSSGRAALLGEGFNSRPEQLDLELGRVVSRVRKLI